MSHSAGSAPGTRHGLRIFLIWLPLAVAADALIWFVWYPHMPPGRMTDQAQGQQFDIAVMAVLAAPVLLFVWVYFAYALVVWRRRPGDDEDGPPLHGNTKIQATWITATAVIVLGLFVFGTVQLILPAGAGAGEGPSPIWNPSSANRLGVKADANPGVDNVAYAKPQELGSFTVRCNELCGIWHGAMFNYGHVVTPAVFTVWARSMQAREARIGILRALPPYALTYNPTVVPQLGQDLVKVAGITGANGYWTPSLTQSGDKGDVFSP